MGTAAPAFDDLADRIMAVLGTVPDPEIPVVSVTDLGIVRGIQQDPPAVLITPTYSGCPATVVIEQSVRRALDGAGFGGVPIKTILSPPWTTDWITERGREQLRDYGIAPPPRGSAARSLRGDEPVECPRCGSTDTQEISRFGSTPCKAQWRCRACLEPFDRFKCH
jgi:ring-1,2-phenylacetyl-CoA epoxidase subunit PaaD